MTDLSYHVPELWMMVSEVDLLLFGQTLQPIVTTTTGSQSIFPQAVSHAEQTQSKHHHLGT